MRRKFLSLTSVVIFLLSSFHLHGAAIAKGDLLRAGDRWLQASNFLPDSQLADLPDSTRQLHNNFSWDTMVLLPLRPSGYLVMSTDDRLPPVIAFSENSLSAPHFIPGHPFYALLQAQDEQFSAVITQPATRGANDEFTANALLWQQLLEVAPTRAAPIEPGSILQSPLLSTTWDQNFPFDHFVPSSAANIYEHAPVGCVPLAIAQLLKFHQWPYRGQGSESHTDSKGSLRATLAADLSRPFNWEVMPDSLLDFAGLVPTPSIKLLAQACLAFGVFLGSDYDVEDGTATYSNTIPDFFASNLFFQSDTFKMSSDTFKMSNVDSSYNNYISQTTLYANIKADIEAGRPAYVGFSSNVIGAHSFITDGLAEHSGKNYYHFNYGWGSREDGWYLLNSGYANSVITNGITNIQPQFLAQFQDMPHEQAPNLTLQWQFPPYHANEVTAFRLQATRNGQTVTLTDQIPATARSWSLTNQAQGEVKYTITAKKGTNWQGSDSMQLLITAAPQDRIVSIQPIVSKQPVTKPFVLEVTVPDLPAIVLSAKTSRPDIYPDKNCVISGEGTNRTLTLTPAMTSRVGNVLVWLTASQGSWQAQATTDLVVQRPEVPMAGAGSAVGNPQQNFFTEGHASWKVQNTTYATPPSALHINNVEGETFTSLIEFARLYTYVTGPCRIKFKWMVRSVPQEPTYPNSGYLIFAVDDIVQERISGQKNWTEATFVIAQPGQHQLSWTLQWAFWMAENGYYTRYENKAWLDDFSWQALQPVTVTGGTAETEFAGTAAEIFSAEGEEVTLSAVPSCSECTFSHWETVPAVPLGNAMAAETTFTMPSQAVQATAIYNRSTTLSLTSGWNLINLPMTPDQGSRSILANYPAFSGQYPNSQVQYSRTSTFSGGHAYWLLNRQTDTVELYLSGTFTSPLPLPSTAGWHLFAPGVEQEIPPSILAWKWHESAYESVSDGILRPSQAYWLWVSE